MQFIQDPTAVTTRPAAPTLSGPVGWFAPAVPGISVATRLRYWFMNMVMSELTNLCLNNGRACDGTSEGDVMAAIQTMIMNNGETVGCILALFQTPGTFSYTVPAGVVALDIEMWGGGSGSWASTTSISGGGGSSGGYVRAAAAGFVPGQVITLQVGAGGSGGTVSGPTPPTPGSSSTIAAGALGGALIAPGGVLNGLDSVGAPSFGNLAGTTGYILSAASQLLMVGSDGQSAIGTQGGMGGAAPCGGGSPNSGTTGRAGYFPGGGASGAGCPAGTAYDGAAGAGGLVMIRC